MAERMRRDIAEASDKRPEETDSTKREVLEDSSTAPMTQAGRHESPVEVKHEDAQQPVNHAEIEVDPSTKTDGEALVNGPGEAIDTIGGAREAEFDGPDRFGAAEGDEPLDLTDLDPGAAVAEKEAEVTDAVGKTSLEDQLVPPGLTDDAAHPGLTDPSATVGDGLSFPKGSHYDQLLNSEWSDSEGVAPKGSTSDGEAFINKDGGTLYGETVKAKQPGGVLAEDDGNDSPPPGPGTSPGGDLGSEDGDSGSLSDWYTAKVAEIQNDDNLSQEEKEEAMSKLAEQAQKDFAHLHEDDDQNREGQDGSGTGGTGQGAPAGGEGSGSEGSGGDGSGETDDGGTDAGTAGDDDVVTEPDDTNQDMAPDSIDPSNINVDLSTTEFQIQQNARNNDDITWADHPGATPDGGSAVDYDGVDYGAGYVAPSDVPADAAPSPYDDPAIDPHDDPLADTADAANTSRTDASAFGVGHGDDMTWTGEDTFGDETAADTGLSLAEIDAADPAVGSDADDLIDDGAVG